MLKNHMSTCKKTHVNMQHLFLMRSPWLTPIRKPSTHQLGQFRPLSRARPARHAPGHAHIGGERVILETTKHAHRPRCNGHLLWQLKKNGFARPGGMVGQTTEAETRVFTRYHSNRGVSAVSRCAADLEIAERL